MTKVFVSIEQNAKQADLLMTQFVTLRAGESHTAMSIMQLCAQLWGIRYDWHDWATVLDEMQRNGKVERTGWIADHVQYYIK